MWPRALEGFFIRAFLKEPKEFHQQTPLHKASSLLVVSRQEMRW